MRIVFAILALAFAITLPNFASAMDPANAPVVPAVEEPVHAKPADMKAPHEKKAMKNKKAHKKAMKKNKAKPAKHSAAPVKSEPKSNGWVGNSVPHVNE